MSFKKTITVYVEKGPDVANAGDLLFQKKADKYWAIHQYNNAPTTPGGYWQHLCKFTHQEAIKWQFGIDLSAPERAHLIGG